MLRRLPWHLGMLLLILASGCGSSPAGARSSADSEASDVSTPQALADPSHLMLPDEIRDGGNLVVAAPHKALVVALTRWASTTVAVTDVAMGNLVPVVTRPTGELLSSIAADRVAVLLRDGVNPSKNSIEILDFKRGRVQLLVPARNLAIVGFTFDPTGKRLVYAEMNLKGSNSRRLYWRVGVADLDAGETQVVLSSRPGSFAENAIPVPLAWSAATGEVYFQGLLPFRGMVTQDIWATKPHDSGLRSVLPEAAYTGQPRLSRDGVHLAYLETKLDALPADYVPSPGAPPGSVLVVANLLTGEHTALAADPGTAFGPLAWSATGNEIVASRREWRDGYFRDVGFLRGRKDDAFRLTKIGASPSSTVTDIGECRDGSLLWVQEDKDGARVLADDAGRPGRALLTLPDGKIQLVGCLGD